MLPTNVMSFMKKMVATEEGANAGAEPPGTFGKLRQTLSSSLLTAQDKVTKLSPRPGVVAETALVEPPPAQPAPVPPPPAKVEREAGKPPSRAGACRVCLKALKPGDVFHTCRDCQHRVCEDCASYSKPTGDDDTISSWRCSVCRRKTAPRVPPAAQDSTDSLLDVPALEALQRRHSEARLGGGGGGGAALAPPRSPELRRHSDVSPASLKELEQGTAASRSNSGDLDGLRRGSGCGGAPAAPAPRRRSMRMPRQRSCDDDKQPPAAPAATPAEGGLGAPPPMPRRASAYDVFTSGGAAPAGTARRASFRGPPDSDTPAAETPAPSKGLSVDEDRPLRRRGSQLPDIAALQRGGALAARVAEIAAESASAAAARQLSVDGEAIKIVIHDVDDNAPRRVVLRRDAADKGHRNRGFGMRVVGGKPDSTGKREAVVVWTVPGGPADIAGLQQGDKVLEWGGVQLTDRSFEEVCAVMERSGSADAIELLIEPSDPASKEEESGHTSTPPSLLVEPDTDKSPSSPTRRKLPKTPV